MADANIRAVITAEDRASAVVKGFSDQLSGLAQIAGGLLAGRQILGFGQQVVQAFSESESAIAELNAVLGSTQNVAGVTSEQAIALSKSLQQVTTFSDESVLHAESLALTFTNLGKDVFPAATEAILNVATIMHSDAQNAAIQLGKALNDPADRIGALTRLGVNFNKEQIAMVQNLQNTGRGMEAQKYILNELATEFGGQARAQAQTFGGQMKLLQNNLNDVEEQMGSVIANALRPFVLAINQYVANNGQFLASLGLGALAAFGFAAAVIAVAGAITIAMAVLGPFSIALFAISALIGGAVFSAAQRLQKQMATTTTGFVDGSKAMGSNGANNFGQAGKAAEDLTRKLADIQRQMDQTNDDFRQSMAQIVQTHQQAVTSLKKQIDEENKAFADAQATKATDAQNANDRIVSDHAGKVRDIESQIKDEQIASGQADNARINDLRVRLAQENEAYNKQVADNAAKYKLDTDQATEQHRVKLTDFQTKLQAETDFLNKHNDEIRAIQNVQVLDEIDRLKQSHQRQLQAFDRQRDDAIRSAKEATNGMAGAFNSLPGQINTGMLAGTGKEMGRQMAQGLKDAVRQGFADMGSLIVGDAYVLIQRIKISFRDLFQGKDDATIRRDIMSIPFLASGGSVEANQPYIVGEKGPELFIPSGNGQIVPNNALPQPQSASSQVSEIHIHLEAQAFMGSQIEGRKFAQVIASHLEDIAAAKNMTAAQMLGS